MLLFICCSFYTSLFDAGLGTTVPDPTGAWSSPDGVTIPMGTGIRAPVSTSNLLYNEYPCYINLVIRCCSMADSAVYIFYLPLIQLLKATVCLYCSMCIQCW